MYTQEQINTLLANENVAGCSETNISYSPEFKVRAVLRYLNKGIGPSEIFLEAGFDLGILGRDRPKDCLRRWRAIYASQGKKGLLNESRGLSGGRPPMPKTDAEKIKYLEARIEYLDAENDFLARLRGIKRRRVSDHPKSLR